MKNVNYCVQLKFWLNLSLVYVLEVLAIIKINVLIIKVYIYLTEKTLSGET